MTDPIEEHVARGSRILARHGYADLTLGHLSARHPRRAAFAIKRRGVALAEARAADVVELPVGDLSAARALEAPLETVLHDAVYRARPDVGAVVHGHPLYATALGATTTPLGMLSHEALLFADGVGVFDERRDIVVDEDGAQAAVRSLGGHRAALMRNHGVLVVGADVADAVLAAVSLERAARLQAVAAALGDPDEIPDALAAGRHYREAMHRARWGFWDAWLRELGREPD